VASTKKAKTLMPRLRDAVVSERDAVQPLDYILITR
jgi:hypothetical protein